MNKSSKNKGFTLAEMLIVVAIIGILVGIVTAAISVNLEKAREATDLANIRSAISMIQDAILNDGGEKPSTAGIYENQYDNIKAQGMTKVLKSTSNGVTNYRMYVKLTQKQSGWQGKDYIVAGINMKTNNYQYDTTCNTLQVYILSDDPDTIHIKKDNFGGKLK